MSAIERARRLVAAALDLPPDAVAADGTFETVAGWDSLAHVRIVLSLEETLGRVLAPVEVVDLIDVPAIAQLLSPEA